MTTLEKVAISLTEAFEPYRVFDDGEADMLARIAVEALKNSKALENVWDDRLSTDRNWNNALDAILNEKES